MAVQQRSLWGLPGAELDSQEGPESHRGGLPMAFDFIKENKK